MTAPTPPEPGSTPEMTVEQARGVIFRRLYGHDTSPPRSEREPGTELGSERLDADCLRLAAMAAEAFVADPDAVATALEIAEQLGWD